MLTNHGGRNTIIYFNLENPFYQSLPLSLSYGHFRVNLTMTYKVVLDIHKNILDFHKNMLDIHKNMLDVHKHMYFQYPNFAFQHDSDIVTPYGKWAYYNSSVRRVNLDLDCLYLFKFMNLVHFRQQDQEEDMSVGKTRDALMKVMIATLKFKKYSSLLEGQSLWNTQ